MKNSGFVLLNKPSSISSRGAGGRIARMFGAKTFGHIGTLDPMASGLLIIALNEATKVIPYIPDAQKEYEFSVQWGIETDTLDIKGLVTKQTNNLECPPNETLQQVCKKFIGEYDQVPPNFSAVHVSGQRAYKLTLAGEKLDIPARRVHIYDLKIITPSSFIVVCSTGTYVRSLARDIAKKCGTVATCININRTKTNGFDIKNAVSLDFLENLFNNGGRVAIDDYLQRTDFGLGDIPVLNLDNNDSVLFQHGGFLTRSAFTENGSVRVYSDKEFIGIGIIENGVLKPKRIINVD